jgi:hypothetical protein
MRALYECDRCHARFTTDRSLVNDETPYQPVVHTYVRKDDMLGDCAYPDMCKACFDALPEIG